MDGNVDRDARATLLGAKVEDIILEAVRPEDRPERQLAHPDSEQPAHVLGQMPRAI